MPDGVYRMRKRHKAPAFPIGIRLATYYVRILLHRERRCRHRRGEQQVVVFEHIGELVHHAIARAHSLDEIACAVLLAVLDSHPPVPSQRIGGIIQQMPLRDEYIGAEEHPPCLKRAFQRQIAILHRATQALEHSRRARTHLDDFRVNARIAVIRTPRDTQPADVRIQRANEVGHRRAQR